MHTIRFGTDGWRAIIADGFTFRNVRIIAQAISDYLHAQGSADKGIAIGFDTRFLSRDFAHTAAEIIASNRIPVYVSPRYLPTPVLSYAVKQHSLAAGIMITASHNPFSYNGVKLKGPYGGSAIPSITEEIQKHLYRRKPISDVTVRKKYFEQVDFWPAYRTQITEFVAAEQLQKLGNSVLIETMGGAGTGYLSGLLNEFGLLVEDLHPDPDSMFHGGLPEPIPENLSKMQNRMSAGEYGLGLALDGDADRFGILDDTGKFVQLHDLFPLITQYLIESRQWSGDIVRSTSMHNTIDRIAVEKGRSVTEVPVGFKNICEKMLEQDILIGGEESGGFGYKNHIPERDGILSCLLTLEMLGQTGQSIGERVRALREKYGPFYYQRIDYRSDAAILARNLAAQRETPPDRIAEFDVEQVSLQDGIKFYFHQNAWMLMRVSDTEPLARIYVGSDSQTKTKTLVHTGLQLLTKT